MVLATLPMPNIGLLEQAQLPQLPARFTILF
jgi:hypothetical protein